MKSIAVVIIILFIESTNIMADNKNRSLFIFDNADAAKAWVNVNDNVMGGISNGRLKITPEKHCFFMATSLWQTMAASLQCDHFQNNSPCLKMIQFQFKPRAMVENTPSICTQTKGLRRFPTSNHLKQKRTSGLI